MNEKRLLQLVGESTKTRKDLEKKEKRDYKSELMDMLIKNPHKHFHTDHQKHVAEQYRRALIKVDGLARPRDYRKMYDGLLAGDPKLRTLRAIYQDVFCAYAEHCKHFRGGGVTNG